MKWYTHELCALIVSLLVAPNQLFTSMIGAVFPDVVEKMFFIKHRSLHELAVYLALAPLAFTNLGGLFLGSVHHILLDATTVYGVTFFGKRVRGPFRTDRMIDNMVMIVLHLALLAFLT